MSSKPKSRKSDSMDLEKIEKASKQRKNPTKPKVQNEKKKDKSVLRDLVSPHVESYNSIFKDDGKALIEGLDPVEFIDKKTNTKYDFFITNINIAQFPTVDGQKLFPAESRQTISTYSVPVRLEFGWKEVSEETEGELPPAENRLLLDAGELPVMLCSTRCNLHGMNPEELVKSKEDANEVGGYFIMNGKEKIIRLQTIVRRNHITTIKRKFNGLRSEYTNYAVYIRSVRDDHVGTDLYFHLKHNGEIEARFWVGYQSFWIPVALLLKAFVEISDRELYEKIVFGNNFAKNLDVAEQVQLFLKKGKYAEGEEPLNTRAQCLEYLAKYFTVFLPTHLKRNTTLQQQGEHFLRRFFLLHLHSFRDKFETAVFMVQKLYALSRDLIQVDNPDALIHHDIILPGNLIALFIKHNFQLVLNSVPATVAKFSAGTFEASIKQTALKKAISRVLENAMKALSFFISTGNIRDAALLRLREYTGYSVIAERINYYRFIANFRAIHRGSSFQEARTTDSRKLLPESYGFVCPVHTPDGGPCGLLNHLASAGKTVCEPVPGKENVISVLLSLGMLPIASVGTHSSEFLTVSLDAKIIGKLPIQIAAEVGRNLRTLKVLGLKGIPQLLEIVLIMPSSYGYYPGLLLYLGPARMYRPVINLQHEKIEYIGPYEQIYLSIACTDDDIRPGVTHKDLDPMKMLSILADLTPFSDFNQSPRNMYQCQMAKQTMGTPCYNYNYRVDKLYRIQTPQTPIVRTSAYDGYDIDEYPAGTNAVVAVISYTGFDMEDGMIINKASYERGFGHGTLYKVHNVTICDRDTPAFKRPVFANLDTDGKKYVRQLDNDGLPYVGSVITKGSPLYSTKTPDGKFKIETYKYEEVGYIDEVRILEDARHPLEGPQRASIKIRYNRNPVIGDKFSSRHGQKGILSQLYPQENMPFSESGMTPDVIINPNAFPSRMTIGMLVESMAGKSGALHGIFQDGSPFNFNEKNTAVDYFAEQLLKAGYNYYGNEPMYSGVTGQEFHCDIYIGVVYYQRLRHMVKDKYQARSTGVVSQTLRQPKKGRKVGGGIRFGEMERDSLIGHGASYLLHDRLVLSSDLHKCHLCTSCGSIISLLVRKGLAVCETCRTSLSVKIVGIPFVIRFLTAELASVNIKVALNMK